MDMCGLLTHLYMYIVYTCVYSVYIVCYSAVMYMYMYTVWSQCDNRVHITLHHTSMTSSVD